jgi:hypothetical protein
MTRRTTIPEGAEWREYPRIPPGEYRAYSAVAKFHLDKAFQRWVCFVLWDVFSEALQCVARVPHWWNLGNGDKPRASRRGKYFAEWVRANGGPPTRGDRLSPTVFRHRMARVEIGDTDPAKSPAPYSVVRRIVEWETGAESGHSVNQSHSQGRHTEGPTDSAGYSAPLSPAAASALAGVEGAITPTHTQGRAASQVSPAKASTARIVAQTRGYRNRYSLLSD